MCCDDEASFWRVERQMRIGAMTVRFIFWTGWGLMLGVFTTYGIYCHWFNFLGLVWGACWCIWFERWVEVTAKWLVERERR
jgi:hypothetical protein